MNTIINFETAKSLKEKGFGMSDEDYVQLPRFYEQDGTYIEYDVHVGKKYNPHRTHLGADTIDDFEAHLTMMDNSLDDIYLAPTIAKTIMWLYERHKTWIWVTPTINEHGDLMFTYHFTRIDLQKFKQYNGGKYSTPTEAYQKAINYTLKNLIK